MYNDEVKVCPVEEPIKIESLKNITTEISKMLIDALMMEYEINRNLFGFDEAANGKPNEPKCYREELCLQAETLEKLCNELRKTMREIGV